VVAHARTGAPEARRLLEAAANGTRAKSERILLRLLHEAGIGGWTTVLPFQDWEVDLAGLENRGSWMPYVAPEHQDQRATK
jgi:hypothetical protein